MFDRLNVLRRAREIVRSLRRGQREIVAFQREAIALAQLAPLCREYQPWQSWAMQPSDLVTVLNDIVINDRRMVVECGAGVSTLFLARLLGQRGGRLVSLEHDPKWAEAITQHLRREDLDAVATVVVAPLVPTQNDALWYDSAVVLRELADERIDLLLVDGPPGATGPKARRPAVALLGDQLADDFSVYLDDIHRDDEREILDEWRMMLSDRSPTQSQIGSLGRLHAGSAFAVSGVRLGSIPNNNGAR